MARLISARLASGSIKPSFSFTLYLYNSVLAAIGPVHITMHLLATLPEDHNTLDIMAGLGVFLKAISTLRWLAAPDMGHNVLSTTTPLLHPDTLFSLFWFVGDF